MHTVLAPMLGTLIALASGASAAAAGQANIEPVQAVLTRVHECSPTLTLRSEALSPEAEQNACRMLAGLEQRFHQRFGTAGRPVQHDGNTSLRANIYASREQFQKYAGQHFNMPTNNGGMYLEGLPDQPGNQAEFVANQRTDGSVHNLGHEYVHYLDGRFNLYGDFCANLHDSHAPPENCPLPAPLAPYLVWWTEGIAEYIAHGDDNAPALQAAPGKQFALSALFDTAYDSNNGNGRIYTWGYLATRFMMERQRAKVEQMLAFTRAGDYPRYQALVRAWGTSMDAEFAQWLDALAPAKH